MRSLELSVKMFVAIAKTLDDESTRFIGTLKHDKKRNFRLLLANIEIFNKTIKVNMTTETIEEVEQIQNYMHDLVYDTISEGAKDISVFVALCRMLKVIYMKYVYSNYKHADKQSFVDLYNSADLFARSFENDAQINHDFENFCLTLINGETFTRTIKI